MEKIKILLTGATGLTGTLLLEQLAKNNPSETIHCLVRHSSDRSLLKFLNLNLLYLVGDSATSQTWDEILAEYAPSTIIHIASIRHIPVILNSLQTTTQTPRLIVIGTTGIYSKYNQYSDIYKNIEKQLAHYPGSYCLLRPTMIYGSHRDKNLHKLIKFCDRYGCFPVFGSGNCLLQPIHAHDLAKAILSALENQDVRGAYDLSGGSVVTFRELLALVEKHLGKPVRPINLPFKLGVWSATALEKILGRRSPVRGEQILRLQEDKTYPHDTAVRVLDFFPRSLDVGLQQEVKLLRDRGII
ncbi:MULTISPECIES: NAD-dependent epimerase/dehydratase family protein [Cyanophyceae]|uniref:NAD-dependent epimerase/dehydratase family protein n=1 Tax=Cyanophyceae TaxID=3028117 RepID=UPI0016872F89|nr:NAD-dependent epimerase/dehydratase family protein [Trichocoleus sp. FACHB-40]MBD2002397.1 NAD-dependent epimerase/dehydratase family protein [Trichocoleus sp. FACHB-40]